MAARTKILFLGFCAGERDLILQWAGDGSMPTVRRLLERGLSGPSMSLPGFFVGSTWESFATGVTPAKHGAYCWEQLTPGTYDVVRTLTGDTFKRDSFWALLSRAGRRVAVLDVPLSVPTPDLNGIQIVEWGAHDAQYGFVTSPPSLAKEVVARFARHPWCGNCDAERDLDDYMSFRDGLVRGIQTKAELTRYFLDRGGWDFFAQVFTESHCIGHQCWHFHDPTHPRHDPESSRKIGDPVKDVYVAIDTAMGRVLENIEEDTTVVFLAGHGMGPKYHAQFLLDDILLRLGVAAPAAAAPDPPSEPGGAWGARMDAAAAWAWHRLPAGIQRELKPWRRRVRAWIDGPPAKPRPTVDPAGSQCFRVSNNFAHGGIRINMAGREPNGKVRRGAECDALCEQLAKDFMDLVNLDTGKPIVNRVLRTAEVYKGPYVDDLPDLLVEWTAYSPTYRIGSKKTGEIRGEYLYCRTGEHKPGGLFIASGPLIPRGRLERAVSILDFAPTLCSMLGVTLADVDGQPIAEIVSPDRRVADFSAAQV
jgi:predicted AlkP superfamily phosphohydrolase/phosphomutase